MLASAGELSAMSPAGNNGRLWVVTPAGIHRYACLRSSTQE